MGLVSLRVEQTPTSLPIYHLNIQIRGKDIFPFLKNNYQIKSKFCTDYDTIDVMMYTKSGINSIIQTYTSERSMIDADLDSEPVKSYG